MPHRNPVSQARGAGPVKLSFFAYGATESGRLVCTMGLVNEKTSRRAYIPGLIQADHGCRLEVDFPSRVRFIGDHRLESSYGSTTARRFRIFARGGV